MKGLDIIAEKGINALTNTKIPIPSPEFVKKLYEEKSGDRSGDLNKHEKAYDAFCRWISLPKEERKPPTLGGFEKRWRLPSSYSAIFKQRKDFQQRRLIYFWDWMLDKFPDVVYAIYKRAIKNSSTDARVFAELISKHIDIERPPTQLNQIVLMGVDQDKINKLFTPKQFQEVKTIMPLSNEPKKN